MAIKNIRPEDMQKMAVPPAAQNERRPHSKRKMKVISAEDAAASLGATITPGEEPRGDEPISVRLARMRQKGEAVIVQPPPEQADDLETEPIPQEAFEPSPPPVPQQPQQAYPPPAPAPVAPSVENIVRAPRVRIPPTMGQQLQRMAAPEMPVMPPETMQQQTVVQAPPPPPPEPDEREKFFNQRTRVTIELSDGIFTIPATCVRESKYSVLVIIPLGDSIMAFVPKPGTQLTLSWGDSNVDAYFPGAYVELPELECGVMSFIKAE